MATAHARGELVLQSMELRSTPSTTCGRSNAINAAVARAAIAESDPTEARPESPERELRLLVDRRADFVELTRIKQRLRWHVHDLELPLVGPAQGA